MMGIHGPKYALGKSSTNLLVMKIVDLLDVAKDDVLFIKDPRGDLLHAAGHFPQVGL